MTTDNFITIIKRFFRIELLNEDENNFEFEFFGNYKLTFEKTEFDTIVENLTKLETREKTELYNSKNYEILLGFQSHRPFGIRDNGNLHHSDEVNKLNYSVGKPSDEYLFFFLKSITAEFPEYTLRRFPTSSYRIRRLFDKSSQHQMSLFEEETEGKEEAITFFDALKYLIPSFHTLKIESTDTKSITEFENLSYSYIFNLAYNLDVSIIPLRIFDEFTRSLRIKRLRRAESNDIEVPKRRYIKDLVIHYQKALSSDSMDLQYLSFYHILEFFYEKVYNEEILNTIRNTLTKPGFSYKRNKDLKQLVEIVQNKLRFKSEEYQINEPEALYLTLLKYVRDFESVKNDLVSYDDSLVAYFKSSEVSFSKGNKVNFDNSNIEELCKNIAQRIYKNRNSIVHSKESAVAKFTPFKDDKELSKEILLIRLIAEEIIIESAKDL